MGRGSVSMALCVDNGEEVLQVLGLLYQRVGHAHRHLLQRAAAAFGPSGLYVFFGAAILYNSLKQIRFYCKYVRWMFFIKFGKVCDSFL